MKTIGLKSILLFFTSLVFLTSCTVQNKWLVKPTIPVGDYVHNIYPDLKLIEYGGFHGNKCGIKSFSNENLVFNEFGTAKVDTLSSCIVVRRGNERRCYDLKGKELDKSYEEIVDFNRIKYFNKYNDKLLIEYNAKLKNFKFFDFDEEENKEEYIKHNYTLLNLKGDTIFKKLSQPLQIEFIGENFCFKRTIFGSRDFKDHDVLDVNGVKMYSPGLIHKEYKVNGNGIITVHHSVRDRTEKIRKRFTNIYRIFNSEFEQIGEDYKNIKSFDDLNLFVLVGESGRHLSDGYSLDLLGKSTVYGISRTYDDNLIMIKDKVGDQFSAELYNVEKGELKKLSYWPSAVHDIYPKIFQVSNKERGGYMLFNMESNELITVPDNTFLFYHPPYFKGLRKIEMNNGKHITTSFLVDTLGNLVFDPIDEQVKSIMVFDGGKYIVHFENGKLDLFDNQHKLVKTFNEVVATELSYSKKWIKIKNINGSYDYQLEKLWNGEEIRFKKMERLIRESKHCQQELYVVYNEEKKCGVVDSGGKLLIPFKYELIRELSSHESSFLYVEKDGMYGFMYRP